jgi:hypothetical protein
VYDVHSARASGASTACAVGAVRPQAVHQQDEKSGCSYTFLLLDHSVGRLLLAPWSPMRRWSCITLPSGYTASTCRALPPLG